MKNLKNFILEGWRSGDAKAPANVQKYLGLKYANGAGGGDGNYIDIDEFEIYDFAYE